MSNNQEPISPIVVIMICMIFSLMLVTGIFFVRTDLFKQLFPQKQQSFSELLQKGKPREVINIIASRPNIRRDSDTLLYLQGKAWYMIAWERYNDDRWREYAIDPNDWFVGKDVDNALNLLNRAAQSERTWGQAMTLIGSIYMDKGWFERARGTFDRVLLREPHNRDAYLNYGIVLSRMGEQKEAAEHLKKWKFYENDADFLRNLFFLYLFNIKDYSETARIGDLFLQNAPRGHFDVPKVRRELRDLAIRFPEYFNSNMVIMRDRPPEFRTRRRDR